jgi:two-component system, cell cycle sensor histidine kinase and response regulator CckA
MRASRLRALVVDDDAPTCALVSDILSRAGYDVTTASRPDEVQRVAGCGDLFDVAVLDVVMPGVAGDEVARRLRTRNADLRILFLTGFPGALFQAHPTLWDGEAFLEKPCSDRALVEAISLLVTERIPPRPPAAPQLTVGTSDDADIEPGA